MATYPWPTVEVDPLLKEDPFQSEHSKQLFEAIDKLRGCGANRDIELPELVIVGDQSAGKSSLLQSLTDIPFPVGGRLCTRFPTRIISRRTPDAFEETKISIEHKFFTAFRTAEESATRQARCESFTQTIPRITTEHFRKVVEEAAEIMGISPSTSLKDDPTVHDQSALRNFSDDVLKIEISGPDRSYFSILDVPGVFQSITNNLTQKDKSGVEGMVSSYMASKQSIIICVASGTNDLANQAVFDMVSQLDKEGQRTVGVITKCDITQHPYEVVDLAKNIEKKFHHGWFVVRNRTPSEVEKGTGAVERYDKEKDFFNTRPWNGLPEDRRGTQALKEYLAKLLCSRIEKAFPRFLEEITSLRKSAISDLRDMGIARSTVEQKRTYLTKIAQDIHSLASQGLRGQYDGMLGNVMKLRMNVREANDMFALEMKTTGHSVPFVDQTVGGRRPLHATHSKNDNSTTSAPIQQSSSYDGLLTSVDPRNVGSFYPAICQGTMGVPFETTRTMENGGPFMTQSITFMDVYRKYSFEELRLSDYNIQATIQSSKTPSTPSITEFRGFGAPPTKLSGSPLSKGSEAPPKDQIPSFGQILPFQSKEKTMPEIYQWIQDEIKTSRGTELQGTLNPDVLPVLFHKQINNWRAISKRHFFNVRNITSDAMMKMLHAICIDSLTRTKVDGLISECNKKSHSRGLTELLDRIDTISSSHLQTNNPAFEQKVSKARRTRFQAALERYRSSKGSPPSSSGFGGFGSDKGSSLTGNELVIDMRDTSSLFAELHMSNSQNLEDEVHDTLKAYYEIARENFVEYVNQLIVEPYLSDSRGPVLFFSPTYLAGLSDKTIEDLGAEDGNLVEKRTSKADELARLDRAKEIAERYST